MGNQADGHFVIKINSRQMPALSHSSTTGNALRQVGPVGWLIGTVSCKFETNVN